MPRGPWALDDAPRSVNHAVDGQGRPRDPPRRPPPRRRDAVCARAARAPRQPRVPVGRDRRPRLPQPPAPGRGVRPALEHARAGRPRDGQSEEDPRGRRLRARRPRLGHALPLRRRRAGRPQPRVGRLSRRAPADHHHRRGLAPGDPSALQARAQRDRRRRHGAVRALAAGSAPPPAWSSESVMAALGFIGLGAMGSRMARRLLAAGHAVVGYNRTPAKADALVAAGMTRAASPRAAAERADAVFSMVSNTEALEAIAQGPDGVLAGLRPGATWVEMSTVSPAATRRLAEAVAARGASMLDAPVSGSVF